MLINEQTKKVQYNTLTNEEQELLRMSCIRFIKNENNYLSFYDLYIKDWFKVITCGFCDYSELTDSLFNLMDFLKNKTVITGASDNKLVMALYNNINIPYEQFDINNLYSTFIEYLHLYFKPFLDGILMTLLITIYKNENNLLSINLHSEARSLTKEDFLERIPFILSKKHRIFFIKLKLLNAKGLGKFMIKLENQETVLDGTIQETILQDILNQNYEEFSQNLF